jgi:ATP-binding cassette subfamily B protein
MSIVGKLAKSVREFKKYAILSPIAIAGESLLEVAIPAVMATLIDDGIQGGNMNTVWQTALILIGLALLSLGCAAVASIVAAKASAGFAKNLRKDLYYKIQTFSFANIDKFSTSSLITRLTTDVTYIQMAFQMIIRGAVRAPLMFVSALIFALRINAQVALIFVVVLPLLILALIIMAKLAIPIIQRVFKRYDKLNNVVEENVSAIRVVKAFVSEKQEKKKFADASQNIFKDFSKVGKITAGISPIMQSAVYITMLLICWFGAKVIVESNATELTTGQLMTMLTYAIQILTSLMMFSLMFVMIIMSEASAKRVCEILDEKPDITVPENPVKEVKDGSIDFENVSFSYVKDKEKECLTDIDLHIKSGETIGIIGGTGTGKTTLVSLISRLYDITEGSLKVGGVEVKDYALKTLRDAVSVVLQKNVLFTGTITENIKWGDENATQEDVERVCKLAQADSFVTKFPNQYNTMIEEGGSNVSGGQKQRLCIARALLKKPKILILDDSTSAVDTKTDRLIQDALKHEIPETTKIIIAQRISSVEDCDRIIVMDDGKIDGIGTHDELVKNNKIYREVYDSQMKGSDIDG